MSNPRVVELHAGHWKAEGSGANGFLNEVREARKVAARVHDILVAASVPVTLQNDDVSSNQKDNVNYFIKHHNKTTDGLIASIHFNASNGSHNKPIGTEVLYNTQKELAAKVSSAISVATGGGLLDRGAKFRNDLGVLMRTKEPAILIEVCFVNSDIDQAIYSRDFEKICQAIAKCLAEAVGRNLKEKEVEELVLTATSRNSIKEVLKRAREKGYITKAIHTDAAIESYDDKQLLNYHLVVQSKIAMDAMK